MRRTLIDPALLALALLLGATALSGAALAGCGAGGVGDPCDTPGSEEQCEDGAVCSERRSCPADDPGCGVAGRCRLICNDDTDCPDNGSCEDVSGAGVKSCIPTR